MGCDIHCYMEYKTADYEDSYSRWRPMGGRINPGRNYRIFGYLAGVRDDEVEQVAPLRGFPEDAGYAAHGDEWLYIVEEETREKGCASRENAESWVKYGSKYKLDADGKPTHVSHPDWHSHSWVTSDEWEKAIKKDKDDSWCFQYGAMLAALRYLEKKGCQTRIVFWFDN